MVAVFYLQFFCYSQPAIPKFESFQPINLTCSTPLSSPQLPAQYNSILPRDQYAEQNQRILQQSGIMTMPGQTIQKQTPAELMQEEKEDEAKLKEYAKMMEFKAYQNNFQQFMQLNPDKFSVTKAVYLAESAYDPTMSPYEVFEAGIKHVGDLVRKLLRQEGLSEEDNTAVMYGIQKLYSQANTFSNPKTDGTYTIERLHYDFDDYLGEKDWRKMFVSKVLQTGTGQCHNLPLFFLCVAEQLNGKAYLSLAPNHSFIQYFDDRGNRYNFEATNGNLVSQTWLAQSTFVTATALRNKTYLDTLSSKKFYAQCLGDFLLGYLTKMKRYDDFSEQITKKILEVDSTNITALMERANLSYTIFLSELKMAGNPPPNKYLAYPRLNAAYENFQHSKQKVDQTGFQQMPEEAYSKWLKSLDYEKQKQEGKIQQDKLEREIKRLKKLKSILINHPPK